MSDAIDDEVDETNEYALRLVELVQRGMFKRHESMTKLHGSFKMKAD